MDNYTSRKQQRIEKWAEDRAHNFARREEVKKEASVWLKEEERKLNKLRWGIFLVVSIPGVYLLFFPADPESTWLIYLTGVLLGILTHMFFQNTGAYTEYRKALKWSRKIHR